MINADKSVKEYPIRKTNEFMCIVNPLLPVEETVIVCDIKTKLEVKFLTGKMTHCVRIGHNLIISQILCDFFKKL